MTYVLYSIQSKFRANSDKIEAVAALLQQVNSLTNLIEQQSRGQNINIIALAYETKLLMKPEDKTVARRLLFTYMKKAYIRTFLSPQWAYKACQAIVVRCQRENPDLTERTDFQMNGEDCEAYSNCLLFLEQCSRRWPACLAMKQSLQALFSRTRSETST